MQLLQSFFSFLEYERRYSSHTISAYKTDLKQCRDYLVESFDITEWGKVESRHLRRWLVALSRKGLEERTINRKISSLSSFYSFLKSRNKVDRDPSLKLSTLKPKKRLPNTLPDDEMKWQQKDYTSMEFPEVRNYLIISLFIQTGIRRAELLSLKERDVATEETQIRVLGKGKKERIVPIHKKLARLIEWYLDKKKEYFGEDSASDHLIVTNKGRAAYPKYVYRVVKSFLESETTLQQKSPHVLRHTFATRLADSGADLNAIKTLLGHSSLAATQIYTHTSIDRLKNVYRQAHPKGED